MVTATKDGPLTVAEDASAGHADTHHHLGPPTSSTCAGARSTRS